MTKDVNSRSVIVKSGGSNVFKNNLPVLSVVKQTNDAILKMSLKENNRFLSFLNIVQDIILSDKVKWTHQMQ